jgi:methyl-accepting chemotaxis protein
MTNEEITKGNENLDLNQLLEVLQALKKGDLSLRMPEPEQYTGKAKEVASTLNEIVDINTLFAAEIIKVTRDFGFEGNLNSKAFSEGFEGTWKDLLDCVNMMLLILGTQFRNISMVAEAVSKRDMTKKIIVDAKGEMQQIKNNINNMVDQLAELESAVIKLTSSPNN